jgi:hypothetical protein
MAEHNFTESSLFHLPINRCFLESVLLVLEVDNSHLVYFGDWLLKLPLSCVQLVRFRA